jgi:hypothetical protein
MARISRIAFGAGAAMLAGCVVVYWMFGKVIEREAAVLFASLS